MRQLNIKTKITIWYMSFLIITVCIMLAIIFSVGDYQTKSNVESKLYDAVNDAAANIKFVDGKLNVDKRVDFQSHGVYLGIYDQSGIMTVGKMPKDVSIDKDFFAEGTAKTISTLANTWLVYDVRFDSNTNLGYIRGVASLSDVENPIGILLRLTLVLLPFLLLIASVGGYVITKRAFKPIKEIREAAEDIRRSGDLSRRISLPLGSDEIHMLANAFDEMFDKLEESFDKEKRFSADASHELRTPITVIISQSEYAIEHHQEAPNALNEILKQAQKMAHLLSQLLSLARADKNDRKLSFEIVDITELFEIVVMQQKETALENVFVK